MYYKNRRVHVFGIGSILALGLEMLTFQRYWGYIQIWQLADLFVTFPFVAWSFVRIYQSVERPSKIEMDRRLNLFSFIFFSIFVCGYALHFGADSIDVYMTDQDIRSQIPDNFENLIHFYDEILGHIILFAGRLGMFWILIVKEILSPERLANLSKFDQNFGRLLGFGFGSVMGLYFIEATYFIEIMMVYAVLALIIVTIVRSNYKRKWKHILYIDMLRFAHFAIIIVGIVYYIVFGSFIQPSEMIR